MKKKKASEVVVNASLLKRGLAFITDLILLDFIVVSPFRKVILTIIPQGSFSDMRGYLLQHSGATGQLVTIMTLIGVLCMVYFAISEWKLGQTIGKMIFNISIVTTDKTNMTLWKGALRNIYFLPVFPLPLLWVIEPAAALFSKDHQRLLEKITRTRCVEMIEYRPEMVNGGAL